MTNEEAEGLLTLARAADLAGPETARWVERLTPERPRLAEAVRFFRANGRNEEAAELVDGMVAAGAEGAVVQFPDEAAMREFARLRLPA